MRKSVKKLHLSRETVRSLEPGQLEVVAAAALTAMANCSELITSCNGCNTRNTCTSRYC
jgi:hypothetical protein